MWDFGLALGTAFQLQDDLLDYTASEKDLGKPVLSDAREGKLTLPLLLSLPRATPAERKLIERLVGGDSGVAPHTILEIVHRHGGLERAQELVDEHAERARKLALSLPDSEARDGLLLASEYAARRRK
jgi:geranylgeranyl pyrophosphate synthase